jgi:hypothetical protein
MAATETATDREAITNTVQLYVEGASTGDVTKLREAFHQEAWMFGSVGGQRFDMPIAQMYDLVVSQPMDTDGSYSARVTSVEQVGDVATATLEESGCWGGAVSFVDFFALARIDGTWKIVNKVFAHTAGEMPTA